MTVPKGIAVVIAVGVAVIGVIFLFATIGGFKSADPGHFMIVRNGSNWFSAPTYRMTVPPASGKKFVGIFTTEHDYPATQQTYTISANPNQGNVLGVDFIQDPSADGFEMSFQGTVQYSLDWSNGSAMREFDNKFGFRTYPAHLPDGSVQQLHAWEGDDGWNAFVNAVVRPELDNDFRAIVGNYNCAELQSSCALAVNTITAPSPKTQSKSQSNSANLLAIETGLDNQLTTDLVAFLGGNYFNSVHILITKVTLPTQVQDSIDQTQASFAAVQQAAAAKEAATLQAQANGIKESGYRQCPACAEIDIIKNLPPNLTTFAPGAGFSITGK